MKSTKKGKKQVPNITVKLDMTFGEAMKIAANTPPKKKAKKKKK
jgi:hypothetical protein